jgi:hypothetical protein
MVRFKVRLSCPTVYIPSAIEHAVKQNRWLLIEFIPAASQSSPLFTSVSTPGHGHIRHITTPSPDAISSKDVFNALKQSVLLNFGDVGWGEVGASLAGELFIFLLLLFPQCLNHFPFYC